VGGKAKIFKSSEDLLNSSDLRPYSKLEYLEREMNDLKEEQEHLTWLKHLSPEEREWLVKQDFDKLIDLNWKTQLSARDHIKRCYLEIRNNVESIDTEALNMKKRFEEESNGKKE
jgi:hypothetical protein